MKTLLTASPAVRFAVLFAVLLANPLVPLAASPPTFASEEAGTSAAGEVTLPLTDYLALVERIEAAESEADGEEERFAGLVGQQTSVRIEGEVAHLDATFTVEVRGALERPVVLPFSGLAESATVEPAAGAALVRTALEGDKAGGPALTVSSPGRYLVRIEGRRALDEVEGGLALPLEASDAPVAAVEVELPAALGWSCDGAVVVRDEEAAGSRHLRLATARGKAHALRVKREVRGGEGERALARAAVVTVVELGQDGARRHDVVAVEVMRGELSRFAVRLPAAFVPRAVGTDEGEVVPLAEGDRLVVARERRLTGAGYLYLSAAPVAGDVSLAPVEPEVEVRSRYLVTVSAVAAELEPQPAEAWARVDLDDLPAPLRKPLRALRPSAAWRWVGEGSEGAEPHLAFRALPPAPSRAARIESRDTLSLLTVDGTLVHRESLEVREAGSALEVELPAGASLWSASVDGVAVRPVARSGRLAVPLAFSASGRARVEVVAVQERAVPPGRSELELELPGLGLPVLEHGWRLLLPEGHRYRFRQGDLRPARRAAVHEGVQGRVSSARTDRIVASEGTSAVRGRVQTPDGDALPGVHVEIVSGETARSAITGAGGEFWLRDLPAGQYVLTATLDGFNGLEMPVRVDRGRTASLDLQLSLSSVYEEIVVTAESPSHSYPSSPGYANQLQAARELEEYLAGESRDLYRQESRELRQGLVGGVKPLPVDIPESGKALYLTGALPPPRVRATLQVKGGR